MRDLLLYEMDDRGIIRLTLNRPEVHNAFDDHLILALLDGLERAQQEKSARALVLSGAGKSFSAGADMDWMKRMVAASAHENEQDALQLARMLRRLNFHPLPTIARVNGAAFGGGLGLVACCDIALASDNAQFALSEVRLGLVPATIAPYVLRCIGEAQSRRYFQTAETFDAQKAKAIGLVHDIVSDDHLDQAVEDTIDRLLDAGPQAVGYAKQLIFDSTGVDRDGQRQTDHQNARLIAKLRVSAEGQEGLSAFLNKRRPAWAETSKVRNSDD